MKNPAAVSERKGLRFMVESAFYFSIMSVLVKWAGETVPLEHLVFARSLVALVFTGVWLRKIGVSPWGNRRGLLFFRGFLGLIGLTAFYFAITKLPLADVTVIQYTNPVFVAVLAAIFLGERINARVVGSIFIAMTGVFLIARPSFIFGNTPSFELWHVGAAILGAITSSFAYTTVRKLGETEHPLVVVFWFPLVAAPVLAPFSLTHEYMPTAFEFGLLIAIGLVAQAAQVRLTEGLKAVEAGKAMTATYLQIVFAFGWGVLLFAEIPTIYTIVGAALVVSSTAIIFRK